MNKYYIDGNSWVKKNVPSSKQIEEKPTNNTIECSLCPDKKVVSYLRVIDLFAHYEGIIRVLGYVCIPCTQGIRLKHDENDLTCYIDMNGKRIDPQLIRQGIGKWNTYKSMVHDPEFNSQEEINKMRLASANRVKKGIVMSPKGKRKAQNDNIKEKAQDTFNGRKWLEEQRKNKEDKNE